MTCGGVISGNCATGRMAQQISPASTMMMAIEDAKTGRSMKNLTIQTPERPPQADTASPRFGSKARADQ